MHWVAITRAHAAMDTELPVLAQWLGVTPYDLRMRLAQLPAVLASLRTADEAAAMLGTLRERGHGAVTLDADTLPSHDACLLARELAFGASAWTVTESSGRNHELPYANIEAIFRAGLVSEAENTVVTQEKKFNMGRALLSGGLMMKKNVDRVDRTSSQEYQQALYVFRLGHSEPWLLKEQSLRYGCLGAAVKPTRTLNFVAVMQELRQRARNALYDERLFTLKRKASVAAVIGIHKDRSVLSSNTADNDIAAQLMILALREHQL